MLFRIILAALLLTALLMPIYSQTDLAQTYEIVVINVEGCRLVDPQSVQSLSGLRIGDRINLPGPDSHVAIQRLLRQELFETVTIEQTRIEQDLIWLNIKVKEAPLIGNWQIEGLKPGLVKKWYTQFEAQYPAGSRWTQGTAQAVSRWIENQLVAENYRFDSYTLNVTTDTVAFTNTINIRVSEDTKPVLGEVSFQGNTHFAAHQLQKAMGIRTIRLRRLRPQPDFLAVARTQLLSFYEAAGYADAKIISDSLYQEGKRWHWALEVSEGDPYYFGEISWRGNSRYPTDLLQEILDLQKGAPYSRQQLESRLYLDPQGRDISSLYMDQGHLFFQAKAVETGLRGDTIDLEIQLTEGPIARISSVSVKGNTRTHDEVLLRELFTQPGQHFSRQAIIRSQRALLALGYFNPETLEVDTDVDPATGEVALIYVVEEKRNDKIELSASLRPPTENTSLGLIGTLGFSLNNFSLRGLLNGGFQEAEGDGQQLGIRAQSSGTNYQSYNLSFTEPWFQGKPRPFSVGLFHQRFAENDSTNQTKTLSVTGASIGLGQRLPWGNGGWTLRSELGYQHIRLNQLMEIGLDDGTVLNKGRFNNLYLQLQLSYRNLDDPFFPQRGSRLEISGQWTPPIGTTPVNSEAFTTNYHWLNYHKYRLTAEHYLPISKNVVLKGSLKMGVLAGYNTLVGAPPFERFELGGDGNAGSQQAAFAGNDILALRGYDRNDIAGTANGGAVAFSKATVELRYQFLNMPTTRGYLLGFAEGGNAWKDLRNFNPLDLQRAVGLGIRLQLPMFGTIGFDYGVGLDQADFKWNNWQQYGQFNLVLGFEPE